MTKRDYNAEFTRLMNHRLCLVAETHNLNARIDDIHYRQYLIEKEMAALTIVFFAINGYFPDETKR